MRKLDFCVRYFTKFSIDLKRICMLLMLVVVVDLTYFISFNQYWREGILLSCKISRPISSKLVMVIDVQPSLFWCQFEWPWHSFKVTVVWESRIFYNHYLAKFAVDSDEKDYAVVTLGQLSCNAAENCLCKKLTETQWGYRQLHHLGWMTTQPERWFPHQSHYQL